MPANTPFPVSYWVKPGRLLAGEYPLKLKNFTEDQNRHRLRRLVEVGVTAIIDLTEVEERHPYWPLLDEEAASLNQPVKHYRKPIVDWSVPSAETINEILDLLDELLESGHTVYVHCVAGIGRTGTIIGTYLVRQGITGEEALSEIARLRADLPDKRLSPLIEPQREVVRHWVG